MTAATDQTERLEVPPKLVPVFGVPRGSVRYRAAYGGRGSGKSYSFALMAALFGYQDPLRILCTRELQVSIKESMHAELSQAINDVPWLAAHYEIGEHYIRGANGTEFLFRGLRHNISSIKSMAAIDLCIVEEAEDVPEASWLQLPPTIRAPGSEIWVIWNPRTPHSPVDERFYRNPPDSARIAQVNHNDNPWLPDVLKHERQRDRERMDPAVYHHVWEGGYLEQSEAQVLHGKWRVEAFAVPDEAHGPYYGCDWGFAQDPTVLVRFWLSADQRTLYIEHEAGGTGIDIRDTPALFDRVPGAREHVIRADSARPETISHMQREGFTVRGAKKWSGSVEDGVAWLRGFDEIVIHPRCKRTIEEARLYSHKVDRLTGDVKPQIEDAYNHCWDAIRYGAEPLIRQRAGPMFGRA